MRRWWWTWGGWLACGAVQAVSVVGAGELVDEQVVVRLGPGRQVEVVSQCSFAQRSGDSLPPLLVYAAPADGLVVDWLPDATWPDPEPLPVIRRPWMVTNTALFLDILRGPRPLVPPAAEPRSVAIPPASPAEAVTLEALLKADQDQQQAYHLNASQRAWAKRQAAAGRRFVVVKMATSRQGFDSPALRLRYQAEPPVVPFSTAQATDGAGFQAQSRYRLTIVADRRMLPTYADGYPPFPELALKCAEPNPSWLAAGAAKYATHYDANVPAAARSEDLLLQPVDGEPIPPPAPRTLVYPRPIPVDLLAGLVALAVIVALIRRRRRRTAGTTSSAT